MVEMKSCPISGCGRRCSSQYMMCRSDWWRVSRDTRDEVYRRWQAYDVIHRRFLAHSGGELNELREAREAYQDIRERAIGEAEASRVRSLAAATEATNG